MVLVVRTATRLIDRWEIAEPEFIQYDLAAHKILRTVPWSADFEPSYYGAILRFSPDGKLLYVFGHADPDLRRRHLRAGGLVGPVGAGESGMAGWIRGRSTSPPTGRGS